MREAEHPQETSSRRTGFKYRIVKLAKPGRYGIVYRTDYKYFGFLWFPIAWEYCVEDAKDQILRHKQERRRAKEGNKVIYAE